VNAQRTQVIFLKFEELKLKEEVAKAISDFGFSETTSIQARVIPPALEGRDVIGEAPTGSGKTLAFAIPIAEKIKRDAGVQALVVTPTRELALQVSEVIAKTTRYLRIRVATVYGGVAIEPQIRELRSAGVVVGTPGRLLDHLRRGTLKLGKVKILVLDEADRMLDMGFIEDVQRIIRHTPRERQTLLFSATIPPEIKRLASRFMRSYLHIRNVEEDKPEIEECFIEVREGEKFQLLQALLEAEKPESAIIFCNTKIVASIVAANLAKHGMSVAAIHGDLSQAKRERVMNSFRAEKLRILVATDVAARGIDIPAVSHIFNYDIPDNGDDYTHRIGRTARGGAKGKAFCLLSPSHHDNMRRVHSAFPHIERREFDAELSRYPALDYRLGRLLPRKGRRSFSRSFPRRRGGRDKKRR